MGQGLTKLVLNGMNPYDEFGVEEALKLKEKFGGKCHHCFRRSSEGIGDHQNSPSLWELIREYI